MDLLYGALHSPWLLPVLVVLVAIDGPLPMLPSETVLMSAAAAAFGSRSVPGVIGLFVAALAGSVLGDLAVYQLGRTSNRVLPRAATAGAGLSAWVRANLFRRPLVALAGARFVPGGRLVSTAVAGRLGLPFRRLLAGSAISSALWSAYMLGTGLVVGPMTGDDPLMCVVAGAVMAVLTAGAYAVAARIRVVVLRRRGRVPRPRAALAAR